CCLRPDGAGRHDDIDLAPHQLRRELREPLVMSVGIDPVVDVILPFDVPELAHAFREGGVGIVGRGRAGARSENADSPRLAPLLGERRERGGESGGAESGQQFAAPDHSITRSARSNNSCGSWSPIALAVPRLITRKYSVGASMGRSPGFAPLKI